MENHPIPQDVTGFQFKLVGNMTLKQFGYVGAGVILAVIFFYTPLNFFIKFPLVLLSGLTGVGLAFIPIEGRPMDLMVSNFAKAIMRPNQYVYHKLGGSLSFTEFDLQPILQPTAPAAQQQSSKPVVITQKKEEKLREFLYDMPDTTNTSLDAKESQYLSMLASTQPAQPAPPPPQFSFPTPLTQPTQSMPAISQPISPPQPTQPPIIQPVAWQYPPAIPQAPLPLAQPTPSVQPLPQPISQLIQPGTAWQPEKPGAGVPTASEFPNLVSGVVKDSRGNVLGGILVEVKNRNGESVRAFKSNALGQFASATQLMNGSYIIEFEDPKQQHTFNKIPVEADGSIIAPLEVISVDAREELRRELFG